MAAAATPLLLSAALCPALGGTRTAARCPLLLLEPPPLPAGCHPSLAPTTTHYSLLRLLHLCYNLWKHSSYSTAPLPTKSKSKSRLWGGASPWRAPRCACTLAVTCHPGEQRFRCVRGVRAHPRAPVTCHHCATMPNWCYIPLLLFQPSLIFR